MIRLCLLSFFALVLLSSCKTWTPKEYNDEINAINDTLAARGTQWGTAFGNAAMKKDFSTLKPIREGIEDLIEESIDKVKDMGDVEDSKKFGEAELAFLEYEKEMVHDGFVPFETITSMEQMEAASDKLTKASNMEQEKINNLKKAQDEYILRHKLTSSK